MEGEIPVPLKCISWIIGRWECADAHGKFPTIKDFHYKDIVEFQLCGGQPLLSYSSSTKHPEKGNPMHLESGFLRSKGNDELAFMVAHNFGLTSLEEGKVTGNVIELNSTNIGRMNGAKDPSVLQIRRQFTLVDENKMKLTLWMSTSTTPELTEHLLVIYTKTA